MPEKKKKPEEEEVEIDFGIGKLSFGGLFKGLGNLIDLAGKVAEKGEAITSEGEIKGLGREAKGVYGFTVRTLAGKEPVIESFGNIKETPKGPVVNEVREPMVDVFDEKDHVMVVAELPGVNKEGISIEVKGDILNLTAKGKVRKYSKEVLLPSVVDKSTLTSTYKNGVLEVKIKKVPKV